MADVKEILVIDDHFEMLESLRSMLELSNADYEVLGVPSAEEGFLELQRTPFDLMITDVRLPGMSGFELVRKVREFRPELPIIMITAYSSAQGKQEAEQLGVTRYFQKPLDAEALLASVYAALFQDAALSPADEGRPPVVEEATTALGVVQDEASQRLQALLSDTGAVEAVLVDAAGEVIRRVGQQSSPEIAHAAKITARGLQSSFELADILQSEEPFTIQYQAGETIDVYSANVGRRHFVMLVFDSRARRARIGTVWIFAQRAVKDLKEILTSPHAGTAEPSQAGTAPAEETETPPEDTFPEGRMSEVPPFEWPDEDLSTADASADEEIAPSPDTEARDVGTMSRADEEALMGLLEDAADAEDVDLDAFWEDAASGLGGGGAGTRGLSYDEAVRRGLLPPDLDEGEE